MNTGGKRKSLAEFKRDALSGRMSLKLIERYGKTENDIPARLQGIRKVVSANTVAVLLENRDGAKSELRLDKGAKLIEYCENTLNIYKPGVRDLSEQEKAVLEEWAHIEEEYYKNNPYGNIYWKKSQYFRNSPCPWMSGFGTIRGKQYNYGDKVTDSSVKGEVILRYLVYWDDQL